MNQIVLIALRRPYTFVVMSILIVLMGTKTILHMPTDVFPNITIPVTSVVWIYYGLLPQQVEGRITYLFERFLTSTVEGIKYIHSHSYYGSSITNIFLQDGVDVARAEADIVGIAQNVVKALPPDISPPMVMRLAPSSIPVAMLQISSDNLTPAELYNLAYMRIRPLLVTVPGIVLPHPYGGQDMQVMVNLDQQKLLARHLTPTDIHDVLMKQYLVLPAGDIKIKSTDWIVLTNASPMKIAAFRRYPDQAGRQCVHLFARRRHGAAHGPRAAECRTGQGQTDRHHRRHEEHGGLDPRCGRWDQEDDPARRASLSAGRADQASRRRLDLREGFDLGRRA